MDLVDLRALGEPALEALAHVTFAAGREHAPPWMPDLDAAREELREARAPEQVARALVDGAGTAIAWVAAAPAWGRLWELHPLIVAIDHHGQGHGRRLVREIESIAAARGALTMLVGTSDVLGATSLFGADLYDDPLAQLARLTVHRPHAVAFWQRIGYQIVGVQPDAEGPGMPSISLSRRLARY